MSSSMVIRWLKCGGAHGQTNPLRLEQHSQASFTTTFKSTARPQHSACQATWWPRCTGGSCTVNCPERGNLVSWSCSSGEQHADMLHAGCDAVPPALGSGPSGGAT
jgi:hypothetical protein